MPIVRVEVCGVEEKDLPEKLAEKIQDAFAESFASSKRHVDVRVAAAPPSRFAGLYEPNDEPVWVDILMREMPGLAERRGKVLAFSEALSKILGRDAGAIVLHLHAAQKDRLSFGGKLLTDLEKSKKSP